MANQDNVSWNKVITVCSAFGIPLVSILVAGIVWGTRIDDKMTNFSLKQQEQGYDIKALNTKVDEISVRVDTITQRQKDAQKDNNYRFLMYEHDKKK